PPLPSCLSVTGPISPNRILSHFFFNATATTEIYTLSLHDALPISAANASPDSRGCAGRSSSTTGSSRASSGSTTTKAEATTAFIDRKSTRLNSSHVAISYAVFCLKKKIYLSSAVEKEIDAEKDFAH